MLFVVFLSISLSLDALAISLAFGLKKTKIGLSAKVVICLISIIYFSLSLRFGQLISAFFDPKTASVIGIAMMAAICLYFTLNALKKPDDKGENSDPPKSRALLNWNLNFLGITIKIIKNPMLSDLDKSNTISLREGIYLGTALSIDSISVGIAYSLSGHIVPLAPVLIGVFQFAFIYLGNFIGLHINKSSSNYSPRLQLVSCAVMWILLIVRIIGS